jgi:hypothetical protein
VELGRVVEDDEGDGPPVRRIVGSPAKKVANPVQETGSSVTLWTNKGMPG